MQHSQAAPPPLREQMPTVSPAIEQVVMRALEKDYEKRYRNVREFAQALAGVVEGTEPTMRYTIGQRLEATVPVVIERTALAPQNESERWLEVGNAHQEAGQYKEAIKACNQAVAYDPQNVSAYYARADTYDELKRPCSSRCGASSPTAFTG